MKMQSNQVFLSALDRILFGSGFMLVGNIGRMQIDSRIYHFHVFGEYLTIQLKREPATGAIECGMQSCVLEGSDYKDDDLGYRVFRFQSTINTGNEIIQAAQQFAEYVRSARQVKSLNEINKKLEQLLQKPP